MQNKIIQGSEEWLEAKQSKVSASEVFSLVLHYCRKELEDLGFNLREEKSFRTVQELFLKVKFNAKLDDIDPMHAEFGNGMEPYVAYRLGREEEIAKAEVKIDRSKEFITNEDLHPLAACSPDGYLLCKDSFVGDDLTRFSVPDFDKTCLINNNWGKGALELKTANYFANFDSEKGSRLHYIFQLQMQMLVMNLKWGCLAVLMPKEKQFDEPFFKGKRLKEAEIANPGNFSISGLDQYYDLKHYIYPRLIPFQAMILKSLKCFQADLDAYDTDQSRFPRNSEDLVGLQREKKMWGQLWAEHYGKKQLDEAEELNKLFNERYQAQVEMMFAEQTFDKLTNEIYQKVKASGFDKFTDIIGTEHRMSYIKNGQTRFYKMKGVA